jgi:hypothetical protein
MMRDLSYFTDSATDAADTLARNAIRQCLASERGMMPGSDSYTVDAGKVVAEARFVEGDIEMRWTIGFKDVSREQAINAIATRMQSRLG